MSLALVLGGGGVAGVAWEIGLLLGVQDESRETADRLLQADVILGTSAGAIVGAQLGSGVGLADLYARQLSVSIDQTPPRIDVAALMTVFEAAAVDKNSSITQRLKMVGDRVVSLPIVATEDRDAMISTRLPSHEWPTRPLKITAIDVATGELVVFDKSSGCDYWTRWRPAAPCPQCGGPWRLASANSWTVVLAAARTLALLRITNPW